METTSKYKGEVIILRGLPGSGKSTLAEILSENGKYPYFSIDDYFTNQDTDDYEFKFEENHLAYKQCENNFEEALKNNAPKIILHNTFTIDWEIKPYLKLVEQYKYRIHILTVENYHKNKNIHNISTEQLEKMAQKYNVVLY